jgi:three-Cys-motif partner protein
MTEADLYAGRGQTLVKHSILQKYLERFAHIVCSVRSRWDSITYVDCFSGPWQQQSEQLEDTSFSIALGELRKARKTLAGQGKNIRIRCFFLEEDPAAYAKLKGFSDAIQDAEIKTVNSKFEEAIPDILAFVKQDNRSFPFYFIDPTGWSGFSMKAIAPLLAHGEVLINFMMGHIIRFLDSDQGKTQESFKDLFGSLDFKTKIQGLEGQDREDAVVEAYIHSLRTTGGFSRTCNAIVLRPDEDRTHFHLIYATRSPKGVEVFKEAERKGMEVQEKARAKAALQRREAETGMMDLFGEAGPSDTQHYDGLRDRYLAKAKAKILGALQQRVRVSYDEVLELMDSEPMTWESDLKDWIGTWVKDGRLLIEGLQGRQRVPKRESDHTLVWTNPIRPVKTH